jgi:SAM-dependent methyltransferase
MNDRNWANIDAYYQKVMQDIYPQPPDEKHTQYAKEAIYDWFSRYNACNVLDVGCGEGFCEPFFSDLGAYYVGVSVGDDYVNGVNTGKNIYPFDFNFLPFKDNSFELVFSRHSLEHSPFPILTLMEWHRVSSKYLFLIIPKPKFWGWAGRNHYSVMSLLQARFILARSGWSILEENNDNEWEYRFFCIKLDYFTDDIPQEMVESINNWIGKEEHEVSEYELNGLEVTA